MSSPNTHANPEARLRTMRILWAVFLASVCLYALVAYYIASPTLSWSSVQSDGPLGSIGATAGGFSTMFIMFFAFGMSTVVASFLLKQAFTKRAIGEQNPALLQTGLILSVALCEMAGLFGFIGLMVDGNPFAYLLFAVSALGILLHFPRREQVFATYSTGAAGMRNF
jgi:hypothetical protein